MTNTQEEYTKIKVNEKSECILNNLLDYFEKENPNNDLSYNWIERDKHIGFIAKSLNISKESNSGSDIRRDFFCEHLLLKMITEGKQYEEKLVKLNPVVNKLNRYKDILPCKFYFLSDEYNRVNVSGNTEEDSEDGAQNYINASFIHGPLQNEEHRNLFIAAQGPMKSTVESFWSMMINNNSSLIVTLSNSKEDGRTKFDIYWPKNSEDTITINKEIKINFESEFEIMEKTVILRNFKITIRKDQKDENGLNEKPGDEIKEINIQQIHVLCWNDHTIPRAEVGYKAIDTIITLIDDYIQTNKNSPVVVHCSAGIGRTGTFIAIYNIIKSLSLIKEINKELGLSQFSGINGFYSVFNTVRKLREQRYMMVNDKEQYKYIYEYVWNWINRNFE